MAAVAVRFKIASIRTMQPMYNFSEHPYTTSLASLCSSKSFAMAKALTQAFRISAEALDVGLHEWDFSAVQKNSTDTWIQFDRHFTGSNMSLSWHSGTVRSAEP